MATGRKRYGWGYGADGMNRGVTHGGTWPGYWTAGGGSVGVPGLSRQQPNFKADIEPTYYGQQMTDAQERWMQSTFGGGGDVGGNILGLLDSGSSTAATTGGTSSGSLSTGGTAAGGGTGGGGWWSGLSGWEKTKAITDLTLSGLGLFQSLTTDYSNGLPPMPDGMGFGSAQGNALVRAAIERQRLRSLARQGRASTILTRYGRGGAGPATVFTPSLQAVSAEAPVLYATQGSGGTTGGSGDRPATSRPRRGSGGRL